VNSSSCLSVNNVFATCSIASIDKQNVDCVDEDNSGVENEGDKRVLEAVCYS
jgi:hypothetical protein